MVGNTALTDLITDVLEARCLTAEQEAQLFKLIEAGNLSPEDIRMIDHLTNAVAEKQIQFPDLG